MTLARLESVRRVATWRALAIAITLVIFIRSWWVVGPPVTRPGQLMWILIFVLVASVGRGIAVHRILLDWLPLFAIMYAYDYTRGMATTFGIPTHYRWMIHADRFMFHGTVPTQWMQAHFYDPRVVHWYDVAAGLIYLTHFFASFVLATALYLISRDRWAAYMRRFLLLFTAGLATYILFPAAPPWLAERHGLLPDVQPITGHGLAALHLAPIEPWLIVGAAHANYQAAVPSLHAGFAALVAFFLIMEGERPWRRLWILAYPIAMALSIVYCAEHYVIDVVLGWLYAAGVMVVCSAWEHQREQRRERRRELRVDPPGDPVAVGAESS